MKVRTATGPHETQREWVYHRLRTDLIRGRHGPGATLTIAQLCDELGVSMTPVREALRRLAAEGALSIEPNRSPQVPRPGLQELLTVRDVREMVEGLAARRAAGRITPTRLRQVRRIGAALEQARQQADQIRILQLNEEFHFAVYEAAAEPVLTHMIATLWMRSVPSLRVLFSARNFPLYPMAEQNRSNQALIEALRLRDGDAAAHAVVAEIALGSRLLVSLMAGTEPGRTTLEGEPAR